MGVTFFGFGFLGVLSVAPFSASDDGDDEGWSSSSPFAARGAKPTDSRSRLFWNIPSVDGPARFPGRRPRRARRALIVVTGDADVDGVAVVGERRVGAGESACVGTASIGMTGRRGDALGDARLRVGRQGAV
jgi:hypothetical protein